MGYLIVVDQLVSRFFMRFMLVTKNNRVTPIIQPVLIASRATGLSPRIGSTLPEMIPRLIFTTCVKGRTAMATPCAAKGNFVKGKNVPQRKNIGVRNRKDG